jgi:hypothetical protein
MYEYLDSTWNLLDISRITLMTLYVAFAFKAQGQVNFYYPEDPNDKTIIGEIFMED